MIASLAAATNAACFPFAAIEPDWSSTRARFKPHFATPAGSLSDVASWPLNVWAAAVPIGCDGYVFVAAAPGTSTVVVPFNVAVRNVYGMAGDYRTGP